MDPRKFLRWCGHLMLRAQRKEHFDTVEEKSVLEKKLLSCGKLTNRALRNGPLSKCTFLTLIFKGFWRH